VDRKNEGKEMLRRVGEGGARRKYWGKNRAKGARGQKKAQDALEKSNKGDLEGGEGIGATKQDPWLRTGGKAGQGLISFLRKTTRKTSGVVQTGKRPVGGRSRIPEWGAKDSSRKKKTQKVGKKG